MILVFCLIAPPIKTITKEEPGKLSRLLSVYLFLFSFVFLDTLADHNAHQADDAHCRNACGGIHPGTVAAGLGQIKAAGIDDAECHQCIAGAVVGLVLGILAKIPLIGWIFSLVSSLFGLYCFIGLVLAILYFLKVIK